MPIHNIQLIAIRPRSGADVTALVRAAAEGDQHAWEALVGRYAGLVTAITRSHRLDEANADDVAQTVWLRLFEGLHRIEDPARICAWIATTARRECLSVLRSGRRVEVRDELPEPAAGGGLDDEVADDERDALLWQAVERLGERDQALLRFLYTEESQSYEAISGALGMPIGSIGPTRGRCLARLRREVEALGIVGVG